MLIAMQTRDVLDLVAELERDPGLRGVLEDALGAHARATAPETWLGFEAGDVHAAPHLMRRLLAARVVDQTYRSRSTTCYRLADVDAVREALRLACTDVRTEAADPETTELPADLFDLVEGLDPTKRMLRLALEADRPVHVLLVGPPASAKTLLLGDIARLPGARLALGGTTTRAGLTSFLLGEPNCRYLVLDELDKMAGDDLSALLSVMETGLVSRLQHGRQEQERRAVWVLAGCNREERLPRELRSRFLRIFLATYGAAEFRRVAAAVLERREQCDPEIAAAIAELVTTRTHDVRDAVRIARMARGDLRLARELVEEVLAG